MIARVLSTKLQNTVLVEVERFAVHPLYKKRIKRKKRYIVHDDVGVKEGDKVSILSTKPISKRKRFTVLEVVK
jgi:small subunit ribosomal protein S17